MPEVTSPVRITAAMIHELRLAVKDKVLSPAQFQSMVSAPYTPPFVAATEPISESDRTAAAEKIATWRADHAHKGEAS